MQDVIRNVLELAAQELRAAMVDTLSEQGHQLTGNLANSFQHVVEANEREGVLTMYSADYGVYVNFGVSAANIPFGGTGGKGGTSKYIQGLITFWQRRGLSGKEAVSAAFATAKKHKKEGMPTAASAAFSKSGRRTGFVSEAVSVAIPKINQRVAVEFDRVFEFALSELFIGLSNIQYAK